MWRNYILILSVGLLACGWTSCADKNFGGDDWINYPDMQKLFQDNVDKSAPYNYIHVHQEIEQNDSAAVGSADIPWQKIEDLFKTANLHKKELNYKYKISVLTDTLTSSRTLYYEALDPDVVTRSLSIVSNITSGDLQNVYFTLLDKGTFKDKQYRVLFIPKKVIQIQEIKKGKVGVDSYFYPEY